MIPIDRKDWKMIEIDPLRSNLNKFYQNHDFLEPNKEWTKIGSGRYLKQDDSSDVKVIQFYDTDRWTNELDCQNNAQDDAKIFETEEAEENMNSINRSNSIKSKSISVSNILNGISSIEITNSGPEVSDIWSSDNMFQVLSDHKNNPNKFYSKFSPSVKVESNLEQDNWHVIEKWKEERSRPNIWLPNILYFKYKK